MFWQVKRSRLPSSLLRAQERVLRAYLEDELHLRTRFADLPTLDAMVVGPGYGSPTGSLVVADDLAPARRIYLYLHVVAHSELGELRPIRALFESKAANADLAHHAAAELTRKLWQMSLQSDACLPTAKVFPLSLRLQRRH